MDYLIANALALCVGRVSVLLESEKGFLGTRGIMRGVGMQCGCFG
jgi:hypothetical protein